MQGIKRFWKLNKSTDSQSSDLREDLRFTTTSVGPDDPPDAVMALEGAEIALDGSIRSGKLAGRTMWSAIRFLAIPILLQQLVAACVGLVDKMIAGSLPGRCRRCSNGTIRSNYGTLLAARRRPTSASSRWPTPSDSSTIRDVSRCSTPWARNHGPEQ